jgi:hypothetical protein
MGKVGVIYYTGVDLFLISFFYHSVQLLFGCVLNGTHSIRFNSALILCNLLFYSSGIDGRMILKWPSRQ